MNIRRRRVCMVQVRDAARPNPASLLRGELDMRSAPVAELLCPLDGRRVPLTGADLAVLAALPGDRWVSRAEARTLSGADDAVLDSLLDKTALLGDHPAHRQLVADEARLSAVGWHDLAAVYHRHTRWSDASGDEAAREHSPAAEAQRLAEHVARQGILPTHFVRHDGPLLPLELPVAGALDEVLRRRETVRRFLTDRHLPRADFERVLHGSFGITGTRDLGDGMAALKRTSPSGGGLTAIEPYVMVLRVEGIPSGLYHYRAEVHALTLLEALDEAEARRRLSHYCAGQAYFGDSHAAIVHVARFDRHFWKYVRHGKAYKAVLMDSAHLSQSIYALATEAGLGAWYTAIVNDADIATDFGLDPVVADAVAINGFGIADTRRRDLSFNYRAHDALEARANLASKPPLA